MSAAPHVARRTVRRQQQREIVPLADSTIYEMEQRGEFPKRFYLTHAASSGTWQPGSTLAAMPLGLTPLYGLPVPT